MDLFVTGKNTKEIACIMNISYGTARQYTMRIRRRLKAVSNTHAVVIYMNRNIEENTLP